MNLSHKLNGLFNIQRGEGRLVFMLLLQYFCVGAAFTFIQTTAFTLFLTEFGSQNLPLTYIVIAVILTLLTFIYLQISQRISFTRLLTVNFGSLLAITLLFGVGLTVTNARWLIFALPVLFQIVLNFGNLAFWSLAGRIFNVRQGKRLFGLVGAGQWIAIVIMGFLMPTIVAWVGLTNLLWPAAVAIAGAWVTMLTITRLYGTTLAEPIAQTTRVLTKRTAREANNQSSIRGLLQNRYIRLIFALTLAWQLVYFFLDNIFYGRAAVQYPKGDELAGFIGMYLGGLGILTLLSNFFISGRVISRYGLRMSLLILPVGLVIGTVVMATAGVLGIPLVLLFWTTVATKVWDMCVGLSIDQSARTILYQPLPIMLRARTQTLAEGVVQPLATGLAGVALLVLNAFFAANPLPLIFGLLIVVAALLGIAILIGREYAVVLMEALTKRRLSGAELAVTDPTSISILRQGLRSSHPGGVIYSMRMLEEADPTALEAELPEILNHAVPEVRRYAVDYITRLRQTSALVSIKERLLIEMSPEVKGASLRALTRLDEIGGVQTALGYLNDPHPAIVLGVTVGLLTSGSAEGMQVASQKLHELIGSSDSADRALAGQILGECEGHSNVQSLMLLLRDPDVEVRRTALRATGRLKGPQLWPVVMEALTVPSTRSIASAVLISAGETVLSEIRSAFEMAEKDRASRIQLTKICGRIRGAQAIGLLKAQIDVIDVDLRSATLRALSQCGYQVHSTDYAQLLRSINNEIEHAAWLSAAAVDLGTHADTALLQSALADQLAQCQERVLALLSFGTDAVALQRARDNLLHGDAGKKAYALEVIDIHTPQQLRGSVLAVIDELSPEQRLLRLRGSFPQQHLEPSARLRELISNSARRLNTWTKACALYTASVLAIPDLSELIASQLAAPDKLICETATWLQQWTTTDRGHNYMLSTIEKVIILKTVGIFAETSDEVLAEVAAVTTETELPAGEKIFEKGDAGDSMYIIASGRVRVHDGDRVINDLVSGNVFGEMAILDPEARSASVTTVEDTQLLRLDQQALYELIDDRPEVARGLLKVLSQHLRNRMRDLAELRDQLPLAAQQ